MGYMQLYSMDDSTLEFVKVAEGPLQKDQACILTESVPYCMCPLKSTYADFPESVLVAAR